MSRILIETYRTWDIWFDTDSERFIAENGVNEDEKGKPSLTATRKFVDEFRKANAEFKPFKVINTGYGGRYELTIIGIRKDGRFISENAKGEKGQIADYKETDYALPNPENEPILAEVERLEGEKQELSKQVRELEKKLVWSTLRDYKKTQDYSDFVA